VLDFSGSNTLCFCPKDERIAGENTCISNEPVKGEYVGPE
jgi:hypothetical protein